MRGCHNHFGLKGIDKDAGKIRVKFGKPVRSFRFSKLRNTTNFYYLYVTRSEAGYKTLVESLEVIHRQMTNNEKTVIDVTDS